MQIWLDAHLSPRLAPWLAATFEVEAVSLIDAGMQTLKDRELFNRARAAPTVIMTKDQDFVEILARHGPPPQLIHLTCGNTSTVELQRILTRALPEALRMLDQGEAIVEIGLR